MSDVETAGFALQRFFGETGLEPPSSTFPYAVWEQACVNRWGLRPEPSGRLIDDYIAERGMDRMRMTVVEALHVFHVNRFRIQQHMHSQFRKFEADYDKVEPFLTGEAQEQEDSDRQAQYQEQFDPRNPALRKRRMFT